MTSRAELEITRRKTRDRSAILVIVGVTLLMPPFALASLVGSTVAGLPVTLVYVFAVWLALVAGTAAFARPLINSDDAGTPPDPSGSGS